MGAAHESSAKISDVDCLISLDIFRGAAIRAAKAALEAEARANAARDAAVAQDKVAAREQRERSALGRPVNVSEPEQA